MLANGCVKAFLCQAVRECGEMMKSHLRIDFGYILLLMLRIIGIFVGFFQKSMFL